MSWILVIPFDFIKTTVQAEVDPNKHGGMVEMFKTKTRVSLQFKNQPQAIQFDTTQDYLTLDVTSGIFFPSLEIWMESVLSRQLDNSGTIITNKCRYILR